MLLGIFCSILIGILNWYQSSPNYNRLGDISAAMSEIKNVSCSPELISPVAQNLSPFNKKVANSRILIALTEEQQAKIENEYLKSIAKHRKETAAKPLAVLEYGIMVCVAIAIISLFITVPTIWLIISASCTLISSKVAKTAER